MANEFFQMITTHKNLFNSTINTVIEELIIRSQEHDMDKLLDSNVAKVYIEHFPKLKQIPFASQEYLDYEHNHFWDAHMSHAQNRHHFYSSKNKEVNDPNLIDLMEAVVDIYVSNKQYNETANIHDVMQTFKDKGILDIKLEDYILNTLEYIDKKEK